MTFIWVQVHPGSLLSLCIGLHNTSTKPCAGTSLSQLYIRLHDTKTKYHFSTSSFQ